MQPENWSFQWDKGSANVTKIGGMIGPATFHLPNGKFVQPFAVAPWWDDDSDEHRALPGILRQLRGEWACVPFGMPHPSTLPKEWHDDDRTVLADNSLGIHGPSANEAWELVSIGDGTIKLAMHYPEEHPVKRVTRTITGVPGQAVLAFELSIEVRRDTELPIGLHPVFRLPKMAGRSKLQIGGTPRAHTYPIDVELGVSQFLHDQHEVTLDAIPLKEGGTMDATRHPLPIVTEEILLVTGVDGRASLSNPDEGYKVTLNWDAAAFPSCNLWISNCGRSAYPWHSRHQALGIEPVAAPFDLGVDIARNPNSPLRRAGLVTSQEFTSGSIWNTQYQISVEALK